MDSKIAQGLFRQYAAAVAYVAPDAPLDIRTLGGAFTPRSISC